MSQMWQGAMSEPQATEPFDVIAESGEDDEAV
jgi:hypothetical protein